MSDKAPSWDKIIIIVLGIFVLLKLMSLEEYIYTAGQIIAGAAIIYAIVELFRKRKSH
jgi:hypothetical protein